MLDWLALANQSCFLLLLLLLVQSFLLSFLSLLLLLESVLLFLLFPVLFFLGLLNLELFLCFSLLFLNYFADVALCLSEDVSDHELQLLLALKSGLHPSQDLINLGANQLQFLFELL